MRETLVLVHGVQPQPFVKPHDADYEALLKGIARYLPEDSPWHNAKPIYIEWGKRHPTPPTPPFPPTAPTAPGTPDTHRNHHALSPAQQHYGTATLSRLKRTDRFSLNPARWGLNGLRSLFVFGFGDMFYYVSKDGKASLRTELASRIVQALAPQLTPERDPDPLSLTFLGHSAGSVICADFLFSLFFEDRPAEDFLGPPKETDDPEYQALCGQLERLQRMARGGRLRVRRLITFGSPFALVLPRNRQLVEDLADCEPLNPAHYGLKDSPADRPSSPFDHSPLTGPRWINIWDRDDPIAYPIAQLFNDHPCAQDLYLRVSPWVSKAHQAYWNSGKVHKHIARLW
ncbi:MAG: hypothetical protein AAGI68_01860 [Planctomycetota bacterium]